MKTYFTISLLILMFLTSMGIFGFLSKAHLDQAVPSGDVTAKLAIVDEKIKTEKENIDANRKALKQMDEAVDQTMARTDNENGATKAASLRRSQQKERSQLASEISKSQTNLAALQEQRAPIASEVRKVEAEVGPIKYIAAVIYEGTPTDDILEKAVRFVTMMIVAVFDPLAVLLLIAANWNLKRKDAKVPEPEDDYQLPDPPVYVADVTMPEPIEIRMDDTIETEDISEPVVESNKTETIDEELNLDIEEQSKEWEPELYARKQVRNTDEISGKAQSFLNKVQGGAGVRTNTIESDVEELQQQKS